MSESRQNVSMESLKTLNERERCGQGKKGERRTGRGELVDLRGNGILLEQRFLRSVGAHQYPQALLEAIRKPFDPRQTCENGEAQTNLGEMELQRVVRAE
jgi:hypothetical protein